MLLVCVLQFSAFKRGLLKLGKGLVAESHQHNLAELLAAHTVVQVQLNGPAAQVCGYRSSLISLMHLPSCSLSARVSAETHPFYLDASRSEGLL